MGSLLHRASRCSHLTPIGACTQLLRKGQANVMLSEQDKLPRLPINKLEDAIQDFLRAAEPLLSPTEFAQTKQQAEEFLQNEGPAYHRMLNEYDEEPGRNSYLEVSPAQLRTPLACTSLGALVALSVRRARCKRGSASPPGAVLATTGTDKLEWR